MEGAVAVTPNLFATVVIMVALVGLVGMILIAVGTLVAGIIELWRI